MKMKFTLYYDDRIETRIFNEMAGHDSDDWKGTDLETNIKDWLEVTGSEADWKGTQWKNETRE